MWHSQQSCLDRSWAFEAVGLPRVERTSVVAIVGLPLNNIFENKAGINQLRHTYLTELHGSTKFDTAKEQKEIMKNMGSSRNMISTYSGFRPNQAVKL